MNDKRRHKLLSYAEAAVFLGIKKRTLYSKVFKREIPHYRLGGRLVRFSEDDLNEWVLSLKVDTYNKGE